MNDPRPCVSLREEPPDSLIKEEKKRESEKKREAHEKTKKTKRREPAASFEDVTIINCSLVAFPRQLKAKEEGQETRKQRQMCLGIFFLPEYNKLLLTLKAREREKTSHL